MIDFDRLVLGPAMNAFARPIIVAPPGLPPYGGRGDFREPHTEIALEDGTFSTASPTLGIRRGEFARLPEQGDSIFVNVDGMTILPGSRRFEVIDVRPDGEGDVKLVLGEIDP